MSTKCVWCGKDRKSYSGLEQQTLAGEWPMRRVAAVPGGESDG